MSNSCVDSVKIAIMVLFNVFIFIFGAIIGSFLNVLVLRYGTGQSIIKGGSRCFSCGKKLQWYELIPILSFISQKRKCRNCGSKISWQYPIVEILTGIIFLLIFNFSAPDGQFSLFYYWLVFSILIAIAVYDFKHQIVLDKFVYVFIFLAFFSLFKVSSFLAGVIFFSFFASLWLISKGRWMGFGDAKLALGIGWFLGLENGIWALVFSFWIGAIAGIFLVLLSKKRYNLKSHIPFGPFLALGALLSFLLNGNLIYNIINI